MTLRLRTDSVREFLASRAGKEPNVPTADPQGMCILSGQLLRRNLQEHLNREGIPATSLAKFTTIEELAGDLLDPTDESSSMLAESIRDRLIEVILSAADSTEESSALPLDMKDVLRPVERNALNDLADRLPYEEEDTQETIRSELDDYFRWTDAATDVSPAMRQLAGLDNQFAQLQSNRGMSAFRAIERLIEHRIEKLPTSQQQSRSHLVHSARHQINEQWAAQFDHIQWIAVAGISVFDNPTLRFLATIADHPAAPDVHVFANVGSAEYNAARFDALSVDTQIPTFPVDEEPTFQSDAAATLFRATNSAPEEIPNPITFLEAPTSQRVVEQVATNVRDLIRDGVHPREILVIAPNAGAYQSLVEHAFETVEIPVHVQTRRPYANIPAYRCLRSFIDVITALATDEPLTYGELIDPLRLGYCPRSGHGDSWPIDGRAFTKIEQELHRKQQFYNRDADRYEDQGITFETWRELLDEIPDWTGPWWAVDMYLDDIESLVDDPPETGDDLIDLFGSYLGRYVFQTVDHKRELYQGPAVDTTRTTLDEIHPTSQAERVRNAIDQVGTHYDHVRDLFNMPVSWDEIGRAFSAVLGGRSYGKSHLDQYAIPVVDAGNAYFREASHVFFLGMDADEFPGESPTSTFLHNELRQAVYKKAISGESPYHHLDNRATGFGEALDFYQAALATVRSNGEITLCHTYRDERGNEISWSPFVDLFDFKEDAPPADRPVDRVSVGDWLPRPRTSNEEWDAVADRTAPRERLRTLLYNAYRNQPSADPVITEKDLAAVYDRLSEEPLKQLILPRLKRYHEPSTAVEISSDEPAFDETALSDVTGDPHYPHELDLQAQCGLKYYYYQFLYNFTGNSPNREEIPKYYASSPHYRLGHLPYIIRENYADPRYVGKWQRIIQDLLPKRQSTTNGLAQFDSDQELRKWVETQDAFDSYDMSTIYENLRAERRLVAIERDAGVVREWRWRDGGSVEIDGNTLGVPEYRLDTVIEGESKYRLPIFFTRFSNRASSALKTCYDGAVWEANEETETFCLSCGRGDDCSYHSKYVIDHRMLAGHRHEADIYENKVAGIGLQEQYAGPNGGGRIVAIQNNYTNKFQPFEEAPLESLVKRGFPQSWEEKIDQWENNFSALTTPLDGEDSVQLEANPDLVTGDDCLNCVYRDLCAVPERGVIDQ